MIPRPAATPKHPPWEEIKARIWDALTQLRKNDQVLLDIDVNERSITHRLAMHLEPHFSGWDIDVEYNRVGKAGDPKRIDWNDVARRVGSAAPTPDLVGDTEGRTVYPDIIVHRRTTGENLLVIEVKKSSNTTTTAEEGDMRKLEAFREDAFFNYMYAVYLNIPVGEDTSDETVLRLIDQDGEGVS